MSEFDYNRRPTHEVKVGHTAIGGSNPVRLQSMASTLTMDTDASVAQALRIAGAGAELVRFTAQGVREARNLALIRERMRREGCDVPLVADIHFNPKAAFASATTVEKVRINPGNFVDPGRTFRKIEYTDDEYAEELLRLEQTLIPFIDICKANETAVRLGVNHGSLSDRIMSRYGDTPEGMVESAMEFLRVFVRHGFDRVVISIKASNVTVMVRTVLMLVDAMKAESMTFPLHLGVTEAGDGEDARVKSALGIGTLLALGIGDTIRVSLSEDPECEIPVARAITDYVGSMRDAPSIAARFDPMFSLRNPSRRTSRRIGDIGGGAPAVVIGQHPITDYPADCRPDFAIDEINATCIDAGELIDGSARFNPDSVLIISSTHKATPAQLTAALHALTLSDADNPVIIRMSYDGAAPDEVPLRAAIDMGRVLLSGLADGIMLTGDSLTAPASVRLAYSLLQSARLRFTHTEFIACPGCGRTLFDLRRTLAQVKEATSHLSGLKIGVMGCIVNGPGEMADADYGYVGAGAGKVSLYKGKECIEKNIPADEAVDRLVALIKSCGDWK